ncbi:MAG: proline dehydrogenase family protein [Deltaproteobacteria bacterium]|nr:proline dehydrogenase family protein [Deltaproteobacteria bacterium]
MFGFLVSRMLPVVPKSVVRKVAKRYVAGEDLAAAVSTVKALNARGWEATLDILGEDARDDAAADGTVAGYVRVLDTIAAEGLESNISVKLTHLGMRLDPARAEERLAGIVSHAAGLGGFVCMDMEDSSLTDATLAMHARMRERFGRHVGTVLQAYLRRTRDDAASLAAAGANLRICKGIYREPRAIAFKRREEIRASFLASVESMLRAPGAYVGVATHDRKLVARVLDLAARLGAPPDRFEFQALLGVPVEDMLEDLAKRGHRVRIYVPFGEEWYPYSTRRLKENPKLATYVVRQMLGMGAG